MKYLAGNLASLGVDKPIWDHFFTIAPLVIVGSRAEDGTYDLAPKHMSTPIGWENYYGFVCTPQHTTYQNIYRNKSFTVTFLKPSQVALASLSAAPRNEDDTKPSLLSLPTFPAKEADGLFVEDGYLFLECRLAKMVDGFGVNSIIVGSIVAAYIDQDALRVSEREDDELIHSNPMLAYISPGRFGRIEESYNFPFPSGYAR